MSQARAIEETIKHHYSKLFITLSLEIIEVSQTFALFRIAGIDFIFLNNIFEFLRVFLLDVNVSEGVVLLMCFCVLPICMLVCCLVFRKANNPPDKKQDWVCVSIFLIVFLIALSISIVYDVGDGELGLSGLSILGIFIIIFCLISNAFESHKISVMSYLVFNGKLINIIMVPIQVIAIKLYLVERFEEKAEEVGFGVSFSANYRLLAVHLVILGFILVAIESKELIFALEDIYENNVKFGTRVSTYLLSGISFIEGFMVSYLSLHNALFDFNTHKVIRDFAALLGVGTILKTTLSLSLNFNVKSKDGQKSKVLFLLIDLFFVQNLVFGVILIGFIPGFYAYCQYRIATLLKVQDYGNMTSSQLAELCRFKDSFNQSKIGNSDILSELKHEDGIGEYFYLALLAATSCFCCRLYVLCTSYDEEVVSEEPPEQPNFVFHFQNILLTSAEVLQHQLANLQSVSSRSVFSRRSLVTKDKESTDTSPFNATL